MLKRTTPIVMLGFVLSTLLILFQNCGNTNQSGADSLGYSDTAHINDMYMQYPKGGLNRTMTSECRTLENVMNYCASVAHQNGTDVANALEVQIADASNQMHRTTCLQIARAIMNRGCD